MLRCLAVAVALASPSLAGACPVMTPEFHVLTPASTQLADGGGIVVAQIVQFNGSNDPRGAESTWRFADGSKPTIVPLAPALDLLLPTGAATRLETAQHAKLVEFGHATGKSSVLDAPGVKAVRRMEVLASSHSYTDITAELDTTPPAGALALVVFDKAGKVARSWGVPAAKTATVVIFTSGSCGQRPSGVVDSPTGGEIRLAWVDTSGRLSKLSPAITVTAVTAAHP